MTSDSWKQDPRLKQMAPEKLNYLTSFADQVTRLSRGQILPAFMSMQADAAQKGNPSFYCKKTGCQVFLTASFIVSFRDRGCRNSHCYPA